MMVVVVVVVVVLVVVVVVVVGAAVADPARPGHQELVGAGAVPQEGTAAGEFGQGKGD